MLKFKNRTLVFYITLIFIVSFVLRYKLLFNFFVLDDFILVVNNSFLTSFSNLLEVLNPKNLFSVLPIRCGARPVTIASLIIDYKFYNLNPFGYHLTNLTLHSINSSLLFLFCYYLKKDSKLFPFVVSLFYSLHPVQTEVVSSIGFRADLLLSMFSLISLNLVNLFKNKISLVQNKSIHLIIFCFICLAFFSKENAIVLPVIIFIYTYLFCRNSKLISFSFITFITMIFLFFFFWIERFPVPLYFSIYPSLPVNTIPLADITTYIYTFFTALFYNVLHILYPVNLSVDYTLVFSKYILILMIIFSLSFIFIMLYTKDKYIKFSMLTLLIMYLPASNIIPLVNTIADRYMYFPMIAISILFGLLVIKLQKIINTKLLIFLLVCLFALNTALSYDRGLVYNNQYSLYFDAMMKNPRNIRVLYNMSVAYLDNKEYQKSLDLLNKLIELNPNYIRESVWFLMGMNYDGLDDKKQAKYYYLKSFLLAPQNQEFVDKFISIFPSVDDALYYLLNNTKSLDKEIILTIQDYQKSKNTTEIK